MSLGSAVIPKHKVIQFGSGLSLDMTSKAQPMKERVDKLGAAVQMSPQFICQLLTPKGCMNQTIPGQEQEWKGSHRDGSVMTVLEDKVRTSRGNSGLRCLRMDASILASCLFHLEEASGGVQLPGS